MHSGQTYAVDYIRQQVIAAVGWDRAMNEGFRIHTTIDAELQKVAENRSAPSSTQAEQTSRLRPSDLRPYAAKLQKREANRRRREPAATGIFARRGHRAR